MAQILIVDDEIGIRELLSEILQDEGYSVLLAENATAARQQRQKIRPDLVLLDIWMPDSDGITLLKEWSGNGLLTMPVVMMSGHGTIDTAVEATRIGAVDFLEKPISLQKLLATVKKALKHDPIVPPQAPPLTLDAFSQSLTMREFHKRLEQAAHRTDIIFLKGVTGPMAEICARSLQAPNTAWLDLAALSNPLTQEMLQQATGGVLYIPDLATLGKMQQKNLHFAVERLGKYKLCLVLASSKSLEHLHAHGWDSHLLTRLGEVWVALPDLAKHHDDIPEIASQLLAQWIRRGELPPCRFSSAALNRLRQHTWSISQEASWGELQRLIRNLALTALDEEISDDEVRRALPAPSEESENPPPSVAETAQFNGLFSQPLREARDAFETLYFNHLLENEGYNMSRIAEKSGLERTHLYRKLKQLGIAVNRKG